MIIILPNTLIIYKNEGETPLECLERFRIEQPEYKEALLSYAGRLDPMAEGALLVLIGEENKKRLQYLELDKTYEVEILFGLLTDTGDVLGILGAPLFSAFPVENLAAHLQSFVGTFKQKYPPYSSKTIKGKPLFKWAREGRLGEIVIPEKTSEIYSIELLDDFSLTGNSILRHVRERIQKVKGDFRQKEILASWEKMLANKKDEMFYGIKIKVDCSSGTYMRVLAEEIAKKQNTIGHAWRIKRLFIHQKHQTDINDLK